jgi:hypothetical protein
MPIRNVTVARYFEEVLGKPINDEQGLSKQDDFIISSECGCECAKAIAAAGALLACAHTAGVERDQIIRSVNHIVLVFIYG